MKKREIVAYAITHAPKGVKGGPYEGGPEVLKGHANARRLSQARRYNSLAEARTDAAWLREEDQGYAGTRVIRIVRPARPSEASAVEELVAATTQLVGGDVLPKEDVLCLLTCFADEVRRTRVALCRVFAWARR